MTYSAQYAIILDMVAVNGLSNIAHRFESRRTDSFGKPSFGEAVDTESLPGAGEVLRTEIQELTDLGQTLSAELFANFDGVINSLTPTLGRQKDDQAPDGEITINDSQYEVRAEFLQSQTYPDGESKLLSYFRI